MMVYVSFALRKLLTLTNTYQFSTAAVVPNKSINRVTGGTQSLIPSGFFGGAVSASSYDYSRLTMEIVVPFQTRLHI